jgi:rhodanese-related sulfurtransferase
MTQELQQEIFSQWDRSDKLTIILYDHKGKSAIDTCAWFIGHEMKNTYALVGGIDAWSQQVDPSISRYKLEM